MRRSRLVGAHPLRQTRIDWPQLDGARSLQRGAPARGSHLHAVGELHLGFLFRDFRRRLHVEAHYRRRRGDDREPLANLVEERSPLERLLEVGERPVLRLGAGGRVTALVHARHEDEGDAQALEPLGDVVPHQIGQKHVHDHQIGLFLAGELERGAAPRRRLDGVPRLLERRGEQGEELRVVVHDEYPRPRHRAAL